MYRTLVIGSASRHADGLRLYGKSGLLVRVLKKLKVKEKYLWKCLVVRKISCNFATL